MRSPQRIQYIRDKTYLRYGERKLLVLELIKSGGRAKLFNGDVYPCCWADVLEESRLARPLALQIVRQIKSKVGCDPCLRQGKLPVYHALRGAFKTYLRYGERKLRVVEQINLTWRAKLC